MVGEIVKGWLPVVNCGRYGAYYNQAGAFWQWFGAYWCQVVPFVAVFGW